MNALDRILEEVAALRDRMLADRTTLRLGTVQAGGTVLLTDGASVTPALSLVPRVAGDIVLVATHGRRVYVLGKRPAVVSVLGTWASGATDGIGSTAQSDRFRADYGGGICVVHIDFKIGTAGEVVGTVPTSVPAPLRIVETGAGSDGSVWINAGERNVRAAGTATTRYNANLVYHY